MSTVTMVAFSKSTGLTAKEVNDFIGCEEGELCENEKGYTVLEYCEYIDGFESMDWSSLAPKGELIAMLGQDTAMGICLKAYVDGKIDWSIETFDEGGFSDGGDGGGEIEEQVNLPAEVIPLMKEEESSWEGLLSYTSKRYDLYLNM